MNPAPLVCKQENEQLWTSLPTNYNYANMFISVSKETILFTVILDSLIQVYKLEVSDNMASSGALMRNEVLLTALSRKLKETCRVTVQYKSRSCGNIPELKPYDRTTRVVNINSQAIIYSTQLTEKSAAPFLLFFGKGSCV